MNKYTILAAFSGNTILETKVQEFDIIFTYSLNIDTKK